MKIKDKLLYQSVVCMTIFALLQGTPVVNNDITKNAKDKIFTEINRSYSENDIKNLGTNALDKIKNAPNAINNTIMTASEISYSAYYPVDEDSKEEIKKVRSAFGGEVISAGIDKELGVCIRIKNGNKIATYGNLKDIYVITGERIIKSEAIGTYDSKSNKEFYYQVEDNMV